MLTCKEVVWASAGLNNLESFYTIDTGVTSAVHYQHVLRVLFSGNTRLDVFFLLSWLVTTVS